VARRDLSDAWVPSIQALGASSSCLARFGRSKVLGPTDSGARSLFPGWRHAFPMPARKNPPRALIMRIGAASPKNASTRGRSCSPSHRQGEKGVFPEMETARGKGLSRLNRSDAGQLGENASRAWIHEMHSCSVRGQPDRQQRSSCSSPWDPRQVLQREGRVGLWAPASIHWRCQSSCISRQ